MCEDCRPQKVNVQERLVGEFFLFVNAVQETLNIGCRTSRKSESANARLNLGVVQVHVPFHCGRTLFGFNVREVHRLRVLLQGHRPIDLQALIQRVKNFIGQWTDTTLRAILVVVVGQLARDLFTVHTVADMPSAVGLVDVSLLHVGSSIGPRVNVQQNVARLV
jgi:hypothetical protein